jgi:hypothetical protein
MVFASYFGTAGSGLTAPANQNIFHSSNEFRQ